MSTKKETSPRDHAFFYILNKQEYINEAAVSATTVARHMPDTSRILFTVGENFRVPHIFEFHLPLRRSDDYSDDLWFREQTYQMQYVIDYLAGMGYKTATYMDCDAYLCDEVNDTIEMLNYFMFMGAHAPARHTRQSAAGAPLCFPELCIGFLPMRVCDQVLGLWIDSYATYLRSIHIYDNNDQAPLRDTLWCYTKDKKPFAWYILPPEYGFRYHFPCMAGRKIKVLHGHTDNIEAVIKVANEKEHMRAWEHGIQID